MVVGTEASHVKQILQKQDCSGVQEREDMDSDNLHAMFKKMPVREEEYGRVEMKEDEEAKGFSFP